MGELPSTPTVIVILGITGDLSRRKLLPALLDLAVGGTLAPRTRIVGFSRREFAGESFREFVREAISEKKHRHNEEALENFLDRVSYYQGQLDDPSAYVRLGAYLEEGDAGMGEKTNRLFYAAVPPHLYETIIRNLALSGIARASGSTEPWARILVEKPFGRDRETAQALEALLAEFFTEEQIFLIDHYLAKETVQNLIVFRFSNAIFESVWNREHIEKVAITLKEEQGAEGRGVFYDTIGALRDVGQNHLLQMLAIIAMEHPGVLDAAHIRPARAAIVQALSSMREDFLENVLLRAQYEGYRAEQGVAPDSGTETYFKLCAFVDNERWRGVPFYLESGKALDESKTEIAVFFKPTERCLCPAEGACEHRNKLVFRIQPDEGILVRFWIKKPGLARALQEKTLSYSYAQPPQMDRLPDAHERLLYDALMGDQTLFTSSDEVRAAWKFITPILEAWKETPLYSYKKGSKWPEGKET